MKIKIHEMSFSGLQSYLMCPQKFRYSYIDKVEPEFVPLSLAFGSAVHLALEASSRAELAGDTLPVTAIESVMRNGLSDKRINLEGQSIDGLVSCGGALITEAAAMPSGTVIGIEQEVEIGVTKDFAIIGKIDLLTEETGQTIITDYKTAKKKPSQSDVDSNLQLTTYSIAYPDSKQRIRALIKSNKPHCCDVMTTRTDEQRARVLKMFTGVKDAIESGAFYPHESWACTGCQYYKRCHKEF